MKRAPICCKMSPFPFPYFGLILCILYIPTYPWLLPTLAGLHERNDIMKKQFLVYDLGKEHTLSISTVSFLFFPDTKMILIVLENWLLA